jgi:thiamine biosynthesis lipoprotein
MRSTLRHTFTAMGSECAVVVSAAPSNAARAGRAISAALTELATAEKALSRFDESSGLSALNAATGRWTAVDDRLFSAVAAAVEARAQTGGRFDPSILPALVAAGYDTSFDRLRPHDAGSMAGWSAGAAIDLDRAGRRIRLAPGAAIDLGGIGKGLSAAAALDAMQDSWPQLPGALVDLGGDIAVSGCAPAAGPWRIAIANPRRPGERLGVLALTDCGVATSGRDRRRLGMEGSGHHLIDPATGRPAVPGPLAVTVVAPTAAEAETHATALAITPVEASSAYLESRPSLAALVVPAAGAPFTLGRLPLVERSAVIEAGAAA